MSLDLTGLDNLANLGASAAGSGKPLELLLSDLIEDAGQPRQHFDEEKLRSLAAQIRAKGVKAPVSVKPKNAAGKYVLNHGARRYRASIMAGKTTIPAFVDETHDDYDQAAENIQREGLTPMEIALFIHKRVKAGDKKGLIAERLGQKPSFVSEYLPLVDAPGVIQELARTGKVGAKTLYLLIGGYKDFPAEVERYIAATEEISRAGVLALLDSLSLKEPPPAPQVVPAAPQQALPPSAPATITERPPTGQDKTSALAAPPDIQPTRPVESVTTSVGAPPQARLAILVKVDGRLARVAAAGTVHVIYKDTGETAAVDLAEADIVGTENV